MVSVTCCTIEQIEYEKRHITYTDVRRPRQKKWIKAPHQLTIKINLLVCQLTCTLRRYILYRINNVFVEYILTYHFDISLQRYGCMHATFTEYRHAINGTNKSYSAFIPHGSVLMTWPGLCTTDEQSFNRCSIFWPTSTSIFTALIGRGSSTAKWGKVHYGWN